jgi:hypothetical protein
MDKKNYIIVWQMLNLNNFGLKLPPHKQGAAIHARIAATASCFCQPGFRRDSCEIWPTISIFALLSGLAHWLP